MIPTALLDLASPPPVLDAKAVMARARGENFPVAARVLSRRDRRHLLAVYGFARLADELGDELDGDRMAALDWLQTEVQRAYAGTARHPLLGALQSTLAECALPRGPLLRLIDANRVDQRVAHYETWEQLQAYCELSANPVGELVLSVFGLWSPERVRLSDRVCTALQLVEHLQDVREDASRGRVYLPAHDLARFGCSHADLDRLIASSRTDGEGREGSRSRFSTEMAGSSAPHARLCAAIEFETSRARELLEAGPALVVGVGGRPKLALAAFVAGGRAALDAIERAHFDVLRGTPRANRARRLAALVRVLAQSRALESGA